MYLKNACTKHLLWMCTLILIFCGLSETANAGKIMVESLTDLQKAVQKADPGDVIILKDGKYQDSTFVLKGKGSRQLPIIVRSRGIGLVELFSGVSIEGDFITLEGFLFKSMGNIQLMGTGLRITNCIMSDVMTKKWIWADYSCRQLEIDHCLFENKSNNRLYERDCQLIKINVTNSNECHHIHHNHFRDVLPGKGTNGFETIQIITKGNPRDPEIGDCGTLIERNLFERCSGEPEIISIKSNGNQVSGNTFRACAGALVFRHGDGNVASQNIFLGDGEPNSAGVRIQGTDHLVVNNYFSNLGNSGLFIHYGVDDKSYVKVERAVIAFNTFYNCRYAVLYGFNGAPPSKCTVANNVFYLDRGPKKYQKPVEQFQLFKFVKEQDLDWKWENNIAWGTLGMKPVSGITRQDPQLEAIGDGMTLPALNSPVVSRADASFPGVNNDVFGHVRGQLRSIGAIEYSVWLKNDGPLDETRVGPRY